MRKLILKMTMTLDGFAAGPQGELDWFFRSRSAAGIAWTADVISQAGAHLIGRKSFEDMASFWPSSSDPIARSMNEIPKIVFSKSGFDPAELPASAKNWAQATVLKGDLASEINGLKAQPGKPLLAHGGVGFARSLIETGLIDEYWLVTHPVALGRGMPLFSGLSQPLYLRLETSKAFDSGAIANLYLPS